MALTLKEREEMFAHISLGIDSCTDTQRISTLKINMQEGCPKWGRMYSRVCTKSEKKPKHGLTKEQALLEVEKLVKKVKFGYINIVIHAGVVTEVNEESQFELWSK